MQDLKDFVEKITLAWKFRALMEGGENQGMDTVQVQGAE